MSTNESYTTTWADTGTTLDTIIDEFLGDGLDEEQWKTAIEGRRLTWNNNVRNRIIHREFVYFLPEIMRLLTESNAAQGINSNESNSRATYASVFRRIRGETLAEGEPVEAKERKQSRRLYGKVSHLRSFQNRISKYLQYLDGTASVSQKSESMMEEVSIAQMNSPAPVGILTGAPGQTSASSTTTNNGFGFGVLFPTGCPPSSSLRHPGIHNSVYAPGNNGTSSPIGGDRSSIVSSNKGIGNVESANLQTTVTSSPCSSTQEGNHLYGDYTHLQSGTFPFQECSGLPSQPNESVLSMEFDHLVDYNAYYSHVMDSKDNLAGDSLHDEEIHAEPQGTILNFPQNMTVNHLLPTRPPESAVRFNPENTTVAAKELPFDEQPEDPAIDNLLFESFDGNAHSIATSSNRQPTFSSTHNASQVIHTEHDKESIHQPITDNSYPDSDTEMDSVSIVWSQTTKRVPRVGRKEKEKRTILRGIVLRQREKLKALSAENAELRDIIEAVHVLQVSQKRTSEAVELLLQLAIDNKQGHNQPGNSTSPKHVLPSRTTPAGASHSRQKSTVSSSAGTAATSSSVAFSSKELKKRTGDLEDRIKALAAKLRTMKDNRDLNHDARHGSGIVNHNVRHDSGIVDPDEVHDLELVNQEVKHDSAIEMGISEDGRRPESISRLLRDKIFGVAGPVERNNE